MSQSDAYMFPVIGSVFLFSFYLLFKFFSKEYINLLLTAYFGVFGTVSLAGMLGTVLHAVLPEKLAMMEARSLTLVKISSKKVEYTLEITWPRVLAFVLAAVFTVHYSLTKNWISSNLLGLSFAFTAIKLLHLDSFKTGMILLAGLFIYDIFWVFGTDVMVSVAKSFDVPVKLLFPRNIIASPMKEFTMLGLGDIVIPGVMVSLCLRFDRHLTPESSSSYSKYYFIACFIAYLVGLTTTMTVMHTFKAAQPALLYLSPACILAPLIFATCRRQLGQLFAYSAEEQEKSAEIVANKED
jgi:minor histocompatibility antigen H13